MRESDFYPIFVILFLILVIIILITSHNIQTQWEAEFGCYNQGGNRSTFIGSESGDKYGMCILNNKNRKGK